MDARGPPVSWSICYALSATSIALNVATAPIVGALLAPSAALATLPVALTIIGTMASSMPMSLLMARFGRKAGFVVGTSIGIAGAIAATAAIMTASFGLFCTAMLAIGMLNGTAQLYRFAAADSVAPSDKARAISWVLAGGIAAGVVGPPLSAAAKDVLRFQFAGSYAAIIGLYLVALAILSRLRVPAMQSDEAPTRRLGVIASQPRFMVAVACGMAAYGFMSLIMTATPLAMQGFGHDFTATAWVIQAHVVAMFAPSLFTGRLIARFGPASVATAGLAAIGLAIAAALLGTTAAHFWVSLFLLGLGWNGLFVTGSALLTTVHRPSEAGKTQGLNDMIVFGTAAVASLAAGPLLWQLGWTGMQSYLAPAIIVVAGALAIAASAARTPAAA